MSRPSLFSGIAVAFIVAAIAAPLLWGLQAWLTQDAALRSTIAAAFLVYLLLLIRILRTPAGSMSLFAISLAALGAAAVVPLNLGSMSIASALALSLSRSLLAHRRLPAAALDLSLQAPALLFGAYLHSRSGGLVLALWGFLLAQSLWVLIPVGRAREGEADGPAPKPDPFATARRRAETALERIAQEGGL